MKKHINLVLIFVAVAALVVATVEFKRLHAVVQKNNNATAVVLKRNAAMKAQMEILKPASSQSASTDGASIEADASAKIATEGKAAEEKFARWKAQSDAFQKMEDERMKNDPEYTLKYYASYRADAEMEYAPFCRVRHLSKEQSEALAEAEFQRMLRLDYMQTVQGMDAKATREAVEGVNDEFASSVKAALGDDLYEQFLVYERQQTAWNYVGNLGAMLSLVDMPLSVEQASQLADAMANASPAFQKGETMVSWGNDKIDWDAVDAAVVNSLTPEQMDIFKNADIFMGGALDTGSSRQEQELDSAVQKLGQ